MTCNGYMWRYEKDVTNEDGSIKQIIEEKRESKVLKPVFQYSLDGKFIREFTSATEAYEITNISNTTISKVCNNNSGTAGNYIWKFSKDVPDSSDLKVETKKSDKCKKVRQMNLDGTFVAEYESAVEASKKTGCHKSAIGKTCNGIHKTCGGYKWEFS